LDYWDWEIVYSDFRKKKIASSGENHGLTLFRSCGKKGRGLKVL
jgi:hypothetical protein